MVALGRLLAEQYPAHVADFRKDMGLNYPLVICASAANNEAYKIAGVPTLAWRVARWCASLPRPAPCPGTGERSACSSRRWSARRDKESGSVPLSSPARTMLA